MQRNVVEMDDVQQEEIDVVEDDLIDDDDYPKVSTLDVELRHVKPK